MIPAVVGAAVLSLSTAPATVTSTSTSTSLPVSTTTTTLVAPSIMKLWNKVAWCETHGDWDRDMPTFDGGLGISRVVWNEHGGQDFAPAPHFATPQEQVFVARRIQARAGVPNYVPDQNGECHRW